ncbi:MAG: PEP-CTERM sorting domain-containing protein [Chthonomonadetes bacterium]|nr:PEP-CTERM sorting domain-containing protein [Chthonomonadetes bacterium]
MKRWLLLLAAAGLVLAWRSTDAQSLGRREGTASRQPGNVTAQSSAVPEPGTIVLFASGAAPVVLYALKRYRQRQ